MKALAGVRRVCVVVGVGGPGEVRRNRQRDMEYVCLCGGIRVGAGVRSSRKDVKEEWGLEGESRMGIDSSNTQIRRLFYN